MPCSFYKGLVVFIDFKPIVKAAAIAVAFISLIAAQPLHAGDRSLTNSELRKSSISREREESTATTMPTSLVTHEESLAILQEKQIFLGATVRSLTESLVQANLSAEISRREAADLALKLDTFAISHIGKNSATTEQKLLAAVQTLSDLKKQRDEARIELLRLTEEVATLLKKVEQIDPAARLAVEAQLRRAKDTVTFKNDDGDGKISSSPSFSTISLTNAKVLEVKDDLNLIVANVGRKHGVQIGMPFKILHHQKYLGTVRVVDVRDRICGAVIQNLSSMKNSIQQGDLLQREDCE